jgi:phosphatidylserine/phosphatidylglycerophosphate/cardiolipin synthase-like enzyme
MSTPALRPDFRYYSRPEYFRDLAERASKLDNGDSITLMTMNFNPQVPLIGQLVEELCGAATRGADVRLIIDAMDFILGHDGRPGPLFYGHPLTGKLSGEARQTFLQLEKLRESGGKYWIINQPARAYSNPVAGRSHMKLALINDRVYLGGCNLDSEQYIDMMVSWKDERTAVWLQDLTEKIVAAGNVKRALDGKDLTYVVDDSLTIFIDSGVRKQSVIYQQALALIDNAGQEALIACQYFPGGPTAQHLLAAQKRGVNVTIFFNNPSKHRQSLGQKIYNLRERARLPASFFKDELPVSQQKLHAKLIATEDGALIGSHNYVNIGVNLGTAEIALLSHDPAFAKATTTHLKQQLG